MLMVICFVILFMSTIQPMLMIGFLIVITMLYSVYLYMSVGSYWFSYALLLVMLSGVLVVFTYMVSLMPNESFEMFNLLIICFFMLFMSMSIFMMYSFNEDFISLKMWLLILGNFSLFLGVFLFVMMVVVVELSWKKLGAIRLS